MLLSRVADNVYWGARYLERAECTARVVRSFTEVLRDMPPGVTTSWEPLLAVVGGREVFDKHHSKATEIDIVRFLVADHTNLGSVVASVAQARENLRTTREIIPRDAWQTVNDLFLATSRDSELGVARRSRNRFLERVIADHQRIDGVLSGVMQRDEAYELWRLGQAIERADMTTRVLGVRAAALLNEPNEPGAYAEVQWMGVLRSVTALQMFQRAASGSIEGPRVIDFLLFDSQFPRSVSGCLNRIRAALERLPRADRTASAVAEITSLVDRLRRDRSATDAATGSGLDATMDQVQQALADLNDVVHATFVPAK